ncbi:putative membrane protein [[Clostridium] cellulosi]|uniref:Putative membrane protein n=1 Tax=[Clostridium] cellulosi TaxID=29343 RepID=A0A078KSR1_9FIRM|nr:putative membrane protein [[Clostridium] cellulosi]
MKKKLIDKNLVIEGLLQLKIAGIILFIISFLGTLIVPIMRFNDILYYKKNGLPTTNLMMPINISEIAPILITFMYLAPFIFTLVLFSFLNKRNSSDFYHSLSCNRITLFNSFVVSIIIWIVATIIICVAAGSIAYTAIGIYVKFSYIMWLIGTLLAGTLLIMSCTLFAMTITGTLFTNIIVFGIIFFLPRFILLMFSKTLQDCVNIYIMNDANIANYKNNIPIMFIFKFLDNINISSNALFSSPSAIIYTLSLAIIYFLIAGFLFNIRKSEIAGTSAPNRILQHCYRCIVALPFALAVPIFLMANNFESRPIYITIFVLLSLFVYYLYELLTTKSFKNALNATPYLLVVVVLSVIFGVLLNISRNNILSFSPSTSEIKYVTFLPGDSFYHGNDYYTVAASNINYSEDNTKNKISDILKNNIETIKKNKNVFQESSVSVKITLKNGKVAKRRLFMTADEYSSLNESMMMNEKYHHVMNSLPSDNIISRVMSDELDDSRSIWNSYKEEFAALPDSVKQKVIMVGQNSYYDGTNNIGSITVMGSLYMKNYMQNYRITKDTPQTAKLYINTVNANNKSAYKNFIDSYGSNDILNFLYIEMINGSGSSEEKAENPETNHIVLYDKPYSDSTLMEIMDILKKSDESQINPSNTLLRISAFCNEHNFSYFLPISPDDAKELKKYCNK